METNELYRGRLIDHVQLVVNDLEASKRFYAAVFSALKIPIGGQGEDFFGLTNFLFPQRKVAPAEAG